MDLVAQAIADARAILNGEFSVELTITPIDSEPVIIRGTSSRHSQSWSTDGLSTSSTNAHCTFAEKDLNDLGIVTRNAKGYIAVKNWLVSWKDAINTYTYKILEPFPDNTFGIIRCTLSDYE